MPGCCEPGDLDGIFSPARARSDAKSYVRKGLGGQSRRIADLLRPRVAGHTVLEIGGGIGAVQIELLRAGASRAMNVELSRSYEESSHELIERSGLAERIERRIADFVTEAAAIGAADVVILDRVVCCYPDAPALVRAAAEHARETLVLTLPVERPWMRIARALINLWPRATGSRFRFFVHSTATVRRAAEDRGMRLERRDGGLLWQMLVFAR